jgi:hypothetical protein
VDTHTGYAIFKKMWHGAESFSAQGGSILLFDACHKKGQPVETAALFMRAGALGNLLPI